MIKDLPRVLFLCTGNYYRSRFAEELFNHLARQRATPCWALSRGLKVDEFRHHNPGTISCHTLGALEGKSIRPAQAEREPQQVTVAELEQAVVTVALSEREHRPMMAALFPEYCDAIRYWEVEDIGLAEPDCAVATIERLTASLVEEFAVN